MTFRKKYFQSVKRIVVKIGSAVIDDPCNKFDLNAVKNIVENISELHKKGKELCIVSSGAVSMGMRLLNITQKPADIVRKQALAAVGQGALLHKYRELFNEYNINIAQILLSREDLEDRKRFLNVRNTINELINMGVIPIINENDSVSVEELRFGDNDVLSALISIKFDADLLIMLTTVDGLFDKNPLLYKDATFIDVIEDFNEKILEMADKKTSSVGSGGMHSKLNAAHIATSAGIKVVIANGKRKNVIKNILNGENVGTLICSQKCDLSSREKWIVTNTSSIGKRIYVDDGAEKAIIEKGKSLLPSGIIKVEGNFNEGEIVKILNKKGEIIAKGLTNYSSLEVELIKGKKTSEIEKILGYITNKAVIHRNNMVVLKTFRR